MNWKALIILFALGCLSRPSSAQLLIGKASSEVNFREGPGTNYRVMHSINSSNLLIVLPRDIQNGFLEAFDVETSSRGYIYQSLIQITDTLSFQTQKFFEKSGDNAQGYVEIDLINRTQNTLFVWINTNSYTLSPFEKKVLILNDEEITYFSSAPGLFPVFGRENLKKGETYNWNFSL